MTEQDQMDNMAALLALQELLRIALGEICFNQDPAIFGENVRKIEETAVNSITGRTSFEKAKPGTEAYVKESASDLVTKILSSIRHPSDR